MKILAGHVIKDIMGTTLDVSKQTPHGHTSLPPPIHAHTRSAHSETHVHTYPWKDQDAHPQTTHTHSLSHPLSLVIASHCDCSPNGLLHVESTTDLKAFIACVNHILVSAAKYDVDGDTLSNELQQLGLPKGMCACGLWVCILVFPRVCVHMGLRVCTASVSVDWRREGRTCTLACIN